MRKVSANETIMKRTMKHFELTKYYDLLRQKNWNNNLADVNMIKNNLVNYIKTSIDEICPIIKINRRNSYCARENKWFNNEILQLIKERDTQYKKAMFKKVRMIGKYIKKKEIGLLYS